MLCQIASYPSAAKSPRTRPNHWPGCSLGPASRFATFSTKRIFGRRSPDNLTISDHKPDRSASMPARSPALEMSWQGNPPQITSTGPTSSPFSLVTSSNWRTCGQCFANTRRQNGSISQKATVSNPPVRSKPKLKPPIPEKRSRTRNLFITLTRSPHPGLLSFFVLQALSLISMTPSGRA